MAGVRDQFESEGEMALAALNAGVDLLLDVKDPVAVVDYLVGCVANGTLAEDRIREALDRVWRLKQKAFADRPAAESPPLNLAAASQIARGALELVGDPAGVLPLDAEQPLVAILLKPFATAIDPPEQPLAAALRERFRDVRYIELGPATNDAEFAAALEAAIAAPQLVLAMIVRPAAWHAFGLLAQQAEFVRSLTAARPTIVASLGVPQALDDYPAATVRICSYSDVAVSQQALADALLGPSSAR
jgi:beta-glucosidase-like glycosyl hydrolase